jgi:hypothetical protein
MRPGGRLYWVSLRPTGDALGDIYAARLAPNGEWRDFRRLGSNINSPGAVDESPTFYEDSDGNEVMIFSSGRGGRNRIYESVNGAPAMLLGGGVNSSAADARPSVTKNGLEIFWDSSRGAPPGSDFYTARRSSTAQPFGTAEALPFSSVNTPGVFGTPGFDARPAVSWDGNEMIFASRRDGKPTIDLYRVTRSQVTGRK